MKVYIAGHGGLVGRALLRSAPFGTQLVTSERAEVDLRNRTEVVNFLKSSAPDAIILAAAKVGGIGANSAHQKQFLLNNLEIQNAVIGAASELGIPNLIFLGSSCIYPKLADQPIQEKSLLTGPLEPTNEGYALAKIAGIRLCRAIFEEQGLNYFSLMPTNLYGPHDNFDKFSSHVPAALMRKFHEAKNSKAEYVEVWGTGEPRREFMHVDDMATACWFMLQRPGGGRGELINVGTGKDLKIREFASLMAKVVEFEGEIRFDTSKPDGTPRKLLDVNKIHGYGWSHQIDLHEGLRSTYAWLCENLSAGGVRGY
jgi:GDP-L-fucose synthase